MAGAADHRRGLPERVQDGLFAAVGDGLEKRVDAPLVDQGDGRHRARGVLGQGVGGRKGERDVAAAVAEDRAGAGEAGAGAYRQAAQLACIERGVGGDDEDDRAFFHRLGQGGRCGFEGLEAFGKRAAERIAAERDLRQAAEVGENEGADGVFGGGRLSGGGEGDPTRSRADAALEAEGRHPASGADAAFGDLGVGGGTRGAVMRFADGEVLDVVEVAVVAFEDERVDGRQPAPGLRVGGNRLADLRLRDRADGEGVGQCDRRFEHPEFLDLDEADALTEAVDHVRGGGDAVLERIAGVRDDHTDAGLPFTVGQRAVPDADAGDVGDRVAGAGRQGADLRQAVAGDGRGGRHGASFLTGGRSSGRGRRAGRPRAG